MLESFEVVILFHFGPEKTEALECLHVQRHIAGNDGERLSSGVSVLKTHSLFAIDHALNEYVSRFFKSWIYFLAIPYIYVN